jgi:hypothetical protein
MCKFQDDASIHKRASAISLGFGKVISKRIGGGIRISAQASYILMKKVPLMFPVYEGYFG